MVFVNFSDGFLTVMQYAAAMNSEVEMRLCEVRNIFAMLYMRPYCMQMFILLLVTLRVRHFHYYAESESYLDQRQSDNL